MNLSLRIIFFLSIFFFIIEIAYGFYFSAFTQLIGMTILSLLVSRSKRGHISRMMLLILFFISYPLQFVILITGQSTLSPISYWTNNSFLLTDIQSASVIIVSFTIYSFFILSHNFFSKKIIVYNKKNIKNIYVNNKKKYKIINLHSETFINIFLWGSLFSVLAVIYMQNYFGWGVHGLPPYSNNIFKLLGLSIYLRDYILPILLVILLYLSTKISFNVKILLFILSFLVPISSLTKVSFIIYFALLTYAINKNTSWKSLNWIFLIVWGLFIYIYMSLGRVELVYAGVAVRYQLFLMINSDILSYSSFIDYLEIKNFFSLCERFLGFKELASVIYYKGNIDFMATLLGELGLEESSKLNNTEARELTGSESKGGIGIDWISKLIMMNYLMFIPILLILTNFFLQIKIINILPVKYKLISELIMMLVFIRYAIDGNFVMIKYITYLLIITFVSLSILKSFKFIRHVNG